MRYAVLADVHANLEALTAVLDDARALGAERVVCAGDLVGYHADPNAVVDLLRAHDVVAVAGNHDRAAAGITEPDDFGDVARRAVLWTRGRLAAGARAYLASLPLARVVDGRFLLFHGGLHPAPNADLHLSSAARVRHSIQAFAAGGWGVRIAFFGHTHRAVVHSARGGAITDRRPAPAAGGGETMDLDGGAHHLVNPGSVGQPRDGGAGAAYAVFDAARGQIHLRRVPFDARAAAAKAEAEGLLAAAEERRGIARRLGALARRLG